MALSREREKLLGRLRRRRGREREGLFLVEGIRAVREALAAGARIRFALVSPRLAALDGGPELRAALEAARVEAVERTDAELAAASATEAPQGVLLVCEEPAAAPSLPAGPILVLDGVQDPGNVGTLIRAAAAFGAAEAIALDGTADPWGPKAVRAAAAACFRVGVRSAPWDELAERLAERGPLLVADMDGRDVAEAARRRGSWTLVVGSEGGGVRAAVRAAASERVRVPMPGGTESLNAGVAGSILLYALTREGGGG